MPVPKVASRNGGGVSCNNIIFRTLVLVALASLSLYHLAARGSDKSNSLRGDAVEKGVKLDHRLIISQFNQLDEGSRGAVLDYFREKLELGNNESTNPYQGNATDNVHAAPSAVSVRGVAISKNQSKFTFNYGCSGREGNDSNGGTVLFSQDVRTIHTVGIPRSGSTFQMVLLGLIANLRSSDKTRKIEVIKHHPPTKLSLDRSKMLFTTGNSSKIPEGLTFSGGMVAYAQRYAEFASCPLCEISQYQTIFNLTRDEEFQLRQYMRYWSILRQCCGSQMSKFMRAQIVGCSFARDFNLEGRIDYHMCGSMNLSAVEDSFTQTALYNRFPKSHLTGPGPKDFRHLWARKGDCKRSHDSVRAGNGFNFAKFDKHALCVALQGDLPEVGHIKDHLGHIL